MWHDILCNQTGEIAQCFLLLCFRPRVWSLCDQTGNDLLTRYVLACVLSSPFLWMCRISVESLSPWKNEFSTRLQLLTFFGIAMCWFNSHAHRMRNPPHVQLRNKTTLRKTKHPNISLQKKRNPVYAACLAPNGISKAPNSSLHSPPEGVTKRHSVLIENPIKKENKQQCWWKSNIWGFPKIGVPLLIIHF